MAEKNNINPTLVTVSLACLTAVLAYLGHDSRLTSQRPKGENTETVSLIGDQTQPARLWQDPFSVIKAGISNQADALELSRQLTYWQAQGRQVSILGIFVPGS